MSRLSMRWFVTDCGSVRDQRSIELYTNPCFCVEPMFLRSRWFLNGEVYSCHASIDGPDTLS